MNDTIRERIADAVLLAAETGAPLPAEFVTADAATAREAAAFEHAAALACAAFAAGAGPMPPALQQRLCRIGRELVAARETARPRPQPTVAGPRSRPWLPFALGAAAGVAATIAIFAPARDPAPEQRRLALLQLDGTARIDWQAGPGRTHGTAHGDVVWHSGLQQGYLRIGGLAPLPPDQQYQLWIVDEKRTGAPVDGGLFDLGDGDEHVVPITARLPVSSAKAFVVTVEPRGGVVVSDQKDVVAIASR